MSRAAALGAGKLNRYHKQRRARRRWPVVLTALVAVPLSMLALRALPFGLGELTERAALISAMVNMPEGSLALLQRRFGDKVDERYYQGTNSEVEPYVKPWEEEPEPAPAPAPPGSGITDTNRKRTACMESICGRLTCCMPRLKETQ